MAMKSKAKIFAFSDFTQLPVFVYKTLGMEAYESTFRKHTSGYFGTFIQFLLFHGGTWNLILTIVFEIVYLIRAFGSFENFLQVTALLPCIGVCIGSIWKILAVRHHQDLLQRFMSKLEEIFPQTAANQREYNVEVYRKHVPEVMIPCTLTAMLAVWVFNLYEMIESSVNYFRGYPFVISYPYFVWYPFDSRTDWMYPMIYLHQTYAGYVAVGSIMATDLLLCCIINQLRMHFDYVSRQLLKMVPTGEKRDIVELKRLIEHHDTILRISDEVNEVFNTAILYTLLSSCIIICMTGFQVSAGITNKDLVKYFLFLAYQLVTVFMTCYHGNILIESSLAVSDAAYGQEWFAGDTIYKKCLLVMLMRAKKPSLLNATSFSVVSLPAFSKILSTAYQFFALINTMYRR